MKRILLWAFAVLAVTVLASCTPGSGAGSATPSSSPTGGGPSPSPAVSPAPSPSVAAAASPVPQASPDARDIQVEATLQSQEVDERPEGGPANIVTVVNKTDGRFMARGKADLKRIKGSTVAPVNSARATSTCTDCQSVAVALQVVLYKQGARVVTPENSAIAINERCTRCRTVALAFQYVIPVDDPKETAEDVKDLVRAVDREMRYFESIKDLKQVDAAEAEARLQRLVNRYERLRQYLRELRDETTEENSPTPTATSSPTATSTGTPATATGTPVPAPASPGSAPGSPSGSPTTPAPAAASATPTP